MGKNLPLPAVVTEASPASLLDTGEPASAYTREKRPDTAGCPPIALSFLSNSPDSVRGINMPSQETTFLSLP